MTVPTRPAVSEAMREAVAQWLRLHFGLAPNAAKRFAGYFCAENGPLTSEIARLTGERDDGELLKAQRDAALREYGKALEKLSAAEAETARLRAGIQAIIDGNYDHPRRHRPGQCRHGIAYYDECGNCTDEALAALLSSQEQADV